jgi:hypothetical protein
VIAIPGANACATAYSQRGGELYGSRYAGERQQEKRKSSSKENEWAAESTASCRCSDIEVSPQTTPDLSALSNSDALATWQAREEREHVGELEGASLSNMNARAMRPRRGPRSDAVRAQIRAGATALHRDRGVQTVHASLKPNGVLGIEQHRAPADAKAEQSAKKGYLPEKWVIEHVEAAGFKLAGKSEINANAKDTKDYADGVWALGDEECTRRPALGRDLCYAGQAVTSVAVGTRRGTLRGTLTSRARCFAERRLRIGVVTDVAGGAARRGARAAHLASDLRLKGGRATLAELSLLAIKCLLALIEEETCEGSIVLAIAARQSRSHVAKRSDDRCTRTW